MKSGDKENEQYMSSWTEVSIRIKLLSIWQANLL